MYSKFFYNKYLRYRIENINTIQDIINIFNNIKYFNRNCCTDDIINILINVIEKYPISEEKLQKISLLQQQYDKTFGIEDFTVLVLWTCILYCIEKQYNTDKNKSINQNNCINKDNSIKCNKDKYFNNINIFFFLGLKYGSLHTCKQLFIK